MGHCIIHISRSYSGKGADATDDDSVDVVDDRVGAVVGVVEVAGLAIGKDEAATAERGACEVDAVVDA